MIFTFGNSTMNELQKYILTWFSTIEFLAVDN